MASTGRKKSSPAKKTSTGKPSSLKKTSAKKVSSSRKGSTNNKKKQEASEMYTREIALWIVVAISILLFISNFGIGGTIGNAVSRFFFGIFGLIAYIFPIVLLVSTFFAVSNKGNTIAAIKVAAICLLVVFLCMFLELVTTGNGVRTAAEAYKNSFETKSGGGFFGGFLAHFNCTAFGRVGSYVIDVIVLLISLVLITERSIFKGMEKGGKKVYESAKQSNERHRERAQMRKEDKQLRRAERKVTGVALDTVVPPVGQQRSGSDEVNEIQIDSYLEMPEIKEEKKVALTSGAPQPKDAVLPVFADEMEEVPLQSTYEEPAAYQEPMSEPLSYEEPPAYEEPEAYEEETVYEEPVYEEPVYEEPDVDFEEQTVSSQETAAPEQRMTETEEDEEIIYDEALPKEAEPVKPYEFPPISLLSQPPKKAGDSKAHLQETANKLQQTLKNFGVNVTITNVSCGPAVTRYELQPEMGVKVSKIVNLADDIKLNLAAADIRIEAPIPGKAAIGIEVPNKENVMVSFRELVESQEFQTHPSKISFSVGRDIAGKVVVADIAKMPHLLIAGATGSGKSVCINTIIMSILYKADPKDVKLIMIDPKVVELSVYNGIPHLLIPVVTDPKKASGALQWAVAEMTDRYNKFAEAHVRDVKGYNAKVESLPDVEGDPKPEKMPQIVVIVDELADLMMVASGEVEESICRLAQLARAAGIHLIIATQRPSVNVITGLIKANMPSRIAFAVTSGIDSRTILDMNGAEKLLGKGDMLFNPQGIPKPLRVQGAFVSDKEVSDVVDFIKEHNGTGTYNPAVAEKMNSLEASGNTTVSIDAGSPSDGRDPYFADAARLLIDKEKGSIGMLQRYFKVGFNRAARIMDQLEEAGIVGPEEGTKPRRVLMSEEQFEQYEEEAL